MELSDGLYEIRPLIALGMCVDVSYASDTPGANVLLYGANGNNNQKFYLVQEEADKWSIRCIKSGQYLDVYGGEAAAGTNVVQWPDLDSANQRWKLTKVGENGPYGYPVATIGTWADGTGTAFNMDVDHALTSAMTNILIWSAADVDNQKFVLMPTFATDPRMPMPTDFAISNEKFSDVRGTTMPALGNMLYVSWTCVQSWLESQDNHFEYKASAQLIRNDGSVSNWYDIRDWYADAEAEHGEGLSYWASLASPLSWAEAGDCKAADISYSARSATEGTTVYGTSDVVGQDASATLRVVHMPTVTMDSAEFAPDGLHIGITSDYAGTYTNVLVTDLAAGGRHYVTELLSYEGLGNSDEILIPMSVIGDWIAAGTEIEVAYRVGTEMMFDMGIGFDARLECAYAEGGELTVTPTTALVDGRLLRVTTTEPLDTVWVVTDDGAFEAHMAGGEAFAPYPFGRDFELIVCTRDGDRWGVLRYDATQTAPMVDDGRQPCHAWSWDGGHFLLEHQAKGTIVTSRTIDAQADAYSLDTREWQTVSFSPTNRGSFKASGVLVDGVSEGTVGELLALGAAHHATYRAPSGEVAVVAVTQVSYDASSTYTKVSVSMTQETL